MKSYSKSKLISSVSATVIACSGGLTLGVQSASAQQTDEIVVTGSLIRSRTQDFEGANPVQTLGEQEILNTGPALLQDIFKGIPANSGSQIANLQNELQGVSQFSLRGLGLGSTLTLVNGRRAGLSPVADGSGQFFTDANNFPVNAIKRIEILTDGASATYGSEAVAGVVNVITRNDFEGFEVTGEFRTSTNESFQIGGAFGQAFDKGHFTTFVNYYTQSGNSRGDFDFIRNRDTNTDPNGQFGAGDLVNPNDTPAIGNIFNSGFGSPGQLRAATFFDGFTGANINSTFDVLNGVSGETGNAIADPDCVAAGGILRASANQCRFNFIDQRRLIAEEDRIQIFSQFDYELTDKLKAFGEFGYSRNEIRDFLGGAVLSNGGNLPTRFDPITGTFVPREGGQANGAQNRTANGEGFFVPGDNPFNFFVSDGNGGITFAGPEAFAADPTLQGVDLVYFGRPLGAAFDGVGCDETDSIFCAEEIVRTFNNIRLSGGIDYEITDNIFLNANYTYSDNSFVATDPRDFDGRLFQQAILDGTFNVFGSSIANPTGVSPRDGVSVFGNTQEAIDSFSTSVTDSGSIIQEVAEAVISGDTGISLWGDDTIGVAVGFQYRNIELEFTPDGRNQSNINGRGTTDFIIPQTSQDVFAVFGETILPVTDKLEVQLAVRYEDFGATEGGNTIDPKFAARYDITDQFAIRGSYGTSFQAPSIRQTNGSVGNAAINDPLDPDGGSFNVTVFTQGADDLESQSASNFNIGAIYQSDWGLNVSVDYYQLKYNDLILPGGSAQSIVNADPTGPQVTRTGANVLDAAGNIVEPAQLTAVTSLFENQGGADLSGLDINAIYRPTWWSLPGDVTFDFNTAIITEFTSDQFEGIDGEGNLRGSRNDGNAFGSAPDFKFNAGITYNLDRHLANVTLRHIGGYFDDEDSNPIESNTTVDLRYSYEFDNPFFGNSTSLTAGFVNIFDVDPPQLESRPLFDTEVGDPRGRQFYVGFRQGF